MSANEFRPLWERPVMFVDTETTGLPDNPYAEIVEIAILDLEGQTLLNTKVRPVALEAATRYDAKGVARALEINGYNSEGWDNAPAFSEIKDTVINALEGSILVGQNPKFDRDFIIRGLTSVGVEAAYRRVARHVIDTTTLAWEHLVPCGLQRLNLDAICQFLEITLDRSERHGALADADACRQAYLKMIRATEEQRGAWRRKGAQASGER